jgi:hypothetical protein
MSAVLRLGWRSSPVGETQYSPVLLERGLRRLECCRLCGPLGKRFNTEAGMLGTLMTRFTGGLLFLLGGLSKLYGKRRLDDMLMCVLRTLQVTRLHISDQNSTLVNPAPFKHAAPRQR